MAHKPSLDKTIADVASKSHFPKVPEDAWSLFGTFAKSLFRIDPFERATAQSALQSPLFTEPSLRLDPHPSPKATSSAAVDSEEVTSSK